MGAYMTFLDEIKQIDEKYQQVLATSTNLKDELSDIITKREELIANEIMTSNLLNKVRWRTSFCSYQLSSADKGIFNQIRQSLKNDININLTNNKGKCVTYITVHDSSITLHFYSLSVMLDFISDYSLDLQLNGTETDINLLKENKESLQKRIDIIDSDLTKLALLQERYNLDK